MVITEFQIREHKAIHRRESAVQDQTCAPSVVAGARTPATDRLSYRWSGWDPNSPKLIDYLIDYWSIIDRLLIDYWLMIDDIYRQISIHQTFIPRQVFHATLTFNHATSGKKMSKGDFILFSGAKFYEVNYLISELLRKMKYGREILTTISSTY